MAHDIIDNQNEKLIDHVNLILGSTDRARSFNHLWSMYSRTLPKTSLIWVMLAPLQ